MIFAALRVQESVYLGILRLYLTYLFLQEGGKYDILGGLHRVQCF